MHIKSKISSWAMHLGILTSIYSCQQLMYSKSEHPIFAQLDSESDEYHHDVVSQKAARTHPTSFDFMISAHLRPKEKHDENNELYFLYGAEHLNLKHLYFDIPVTYKKPVQRWIHFFQTRGKEYFLRYLDRAGKYAPLLTKILKDQGLPQDLVYLAMAESGFYTKALSRARAVGVWQFMPYTGKSFGLEIDFFKDERMDPIKSTIAAGKYLDQLYKEFGSWELAASAYNAGEGKMRRAIKRYQTKNYWEIREKRFLKNETREYVPKIMALAILTKNLESFGFKEVEFSRPIDFDIIEIDQMTDLYTLSENLEIPFEEISKLNPELLRWVSPPDESSYPLRVPVGHYEKWKVCCSHDDLKAVSFQKYHLKNVTSLESVARKYKIHSKVLAQLNNVSVSKKLAKGHEVLLPFRDGQSRFDNMYRDLYRTPKRRRSTRKARWKQTIHRLAKQSSKKESSASSKKASGKSKQVYVVRKGDTLWGLSRKTGISLDSIIKSNLTLVSAREIKPGDRIVLQ